MPVRRMSKSGFQVGIHTTMRLHFLDVYVNYQI